MFVETSTSSNPPKIKISQNYAFKKNKCETAADKYVQQNKYLFSGKYQNRIRSSDLVYQSSTRIQL